MDSTKKFWFIANFEIVATFILVIINIPLYLIFISEWEFKNLFALAFLTFGPFCMAVSPPSLISDLIAYLGLIALFVYGIVWGLPPDIAQFQWVVYVSALVFIGVSVLGGFLARFVHGNFYEIVSLRSLYSNSAVSLFESQWKYTLDRFIAITFCIIIGIISIITMIVWCIYK